MNMIKRWAFSLLITTTLALPGCDYVVEGFQDGVEDFVAQTTIAALETILPLGEVLGEEQGG